MLIVFELPPLSILDVTGRDATVVLNNLTTNDVKKLAIGEGIETFVTNVKGKCVGHVVTYRTEHGFRLIGAAGQSESIAAHIDRYVIREDVAVQSDPATGRGVLVVHPETGPPRPENRFRVLAREFSGQSMPVFEVPWIGGDESAELWFIPESVWKSHGDLAVWTLVAASLPPTDMAMRAAKVDEFHAFRIAAGFPWYGDDVTEEHLPQEVGRDRQTISFTKGCYLGQETVARLDALGQVQKQLVRWQLEGLPDGEMPPRDTKLFADWAQESAAAKPVGRLTSVARLGDVGAIALGFARRSHFDAGATAMGRLPGDESPFSATVVDEILL